MANKKRRHVPNVTVYQRGRKWAYIIYAEPDLLTGKRDRIYEGGFESYDEAWNAALQKKTEADRGRHVKPSARTVEQFLDEWLATIEHSIKPSTFANYQLNALRYVYPTIGHRKLQDISVPVLNAFYVQLLQAGRIKDDGNSRMFQYWQQHKDKRDGRGPGPTELSDACGTSYHAARKAVHRFQHRRVPKDYEAGLAPKSVRNIHRMLRLAFKDAVAWDYLVFNPAEHAHLPRRRRRGESTVEAPWTVDELARWLQVAMQDRFAGMWVLVATTGMRRSELAGAQRHLLDLDDGKLELLDTRVVVNGNTIDEDGKSAAGNRTVSLDAFTIAALHEHLAMLDEERRAFGSAYEDNGKLFVWEDGRRPHPDSITARFNRLVDRAGARRIRLHDVRHTYATLSRDAGIDAKIIGDRIGHAKLLTDYVHPSVGKDRSAADLIGKLIADALAADRDEDRPD